MGRYLNLALSRTGLPIDNGLLNINSLKENHLTTESIEQTSSTKETNLTKEVDPLQNRLSRHGIRLCIDKATSAVCLIFRDDVERVLQANCATFVGLDEVPEGERQEIIDTLTYYESILEPQSSHECQSRMSRSGGTGA